MICALAARAIAEEHLVALSPPRLCTHLAGRVLILVRRPSARRAQPLAFGHRIQRWPQAFGVKRALAARPVTKEHPVALDPPALSACGADRVLALLGIGRACT